MHLLSVRNLLRTIPITLGIFMVPSAIHAASMTLVIEPALSSAGQTAVGVYLNPESTRANVVDGVIDIPSALTAVTIRTGDSAVLLWPNPPQFVLADHEVTFTGGTPDTFPEGIPSKLFTLYLSAEESKAYPLTVRKSALYAADGRGTKVPIPENTTDIYVSESTTTSPVTASTDHTPPTVFAELGSNPDLFEDRWYVTFYGTDIGTGIAEYEVKEGWFGKYHTARQYYVLHDQSLRSPVWVRASDAEGNHSKVLVSGTNRSLFTPTNILFFVLVSFFGYYVWRRRSRTLNA